MKVTRREFLSVLAVGGVLGLPTFYDSSIPEVKRVKLDLGFGVTLLLIADAHLHGWGWREEILRKVIREASREADVLLFLGDGYDMFSPRIDLILRLLSGISIPKLGVLGNHEHRAHSKYPLSLGREVYQKTGMKLLMNESVEFMGIKFGGIDWYEDEISIGRSNLEKVGEVDILLSHTPDIIGLRPKAKLVVAGHTHGGQVCLPILGPLWTPSRYGTKYASGLFKEGDAFLYVTRGVGESAVLPLRFNCRREVTLLSV